MFTARDREPSANLTNTSNKTHNDSSKIVNVLISGAKLADETAATFFDFFSQDWQEDLGFRCSLLDSLLELC